MLFDENSKKDIIIKLKAFILDSSASEGEQQNAINMLLKLKEKGFIIGIIPKPVRPIKPKVRKKENVDIVKPIKVISVINKIYKYGYYYKKYPEKRIKDKYKIPLLSVAEFAPTGVVEVELEIVYKTKFYHYKLEYISIDKIDIDTRKIMKKGDTHLLNSDIIKESDYPIGDRKIWDKDAFDEYIDNSKMYISDTSHN